MYTQKRIVYTFSEIKNLLKMKKIGNKKKKNVDFKHSVRLLRYLYIYICIYTR